MTNTLTLESIQPLTVYGSDVSYFTGKLEMYFRAKGIAYTFKPLEGRHMRPRIKREAGTAQMPALLLGDGRWMTDTTPIIDWFETHFPTPPLIPSDPALRFFCLLLEDYADEWLWRPAMHYRWYGSEGAMHLSRHLAAEIMGGIAAPGFAKRALLRQRQRRGYTSGDGVDSKNRLQVEAIYHNNLQWLSAILKNRPFLLGESPCIADIAFMGPFFRHFSQDPAPAEIMRREAPAVWEWVSRLWNWTPESTAPTWLETVPQDWSPLLEDIGSTYLPYLCDNAEAVRKKQKRFSSDVGGAHYKGAWSSNYRVWCLQRLRDHYKALPDAIQPSVEAQLTAHNVWEPLWRTQLPTTDVNRGLTPPFGSNCDMLDVSHF